MSARRDLPLLSCCCDVLAGNLQILGDYGGSTPEATRGAARQSPTRRRYDQWPKFPVTSIGPCENDPMARITPCAAAALLTFVTVSFGQVTFNEFGIPSAASSGPYAITAGPDGNLWFVEQTGNMVGRITTAGVITQFAIPTANSAPFGITLGPDGNLWFTESVGKIGRITTAGTITEFTIPANYYSFPSGITSGPDGNLWFTEQINIIGRITPDGTITQFPVPYPGGDPQAITSGPDGNLWFTMGNGYIGRITTAGAVTEFPGICCYGHGIASGPDGNLWFTRSGGLPRSEC